MFDNGIVSLISSIFVLNLALFSESSSFSTAHTNICLFVFFSFSFKLDQKTQTVQRLINFSVYFFLVLKFGLENSRVCEFINKNLSTIYLVDIFIEIEIEITRSHAESYRE